MSTFNPKKGDIIQVAHAPFANCPVYYVQRFVVRHNKMWFCERDDGRMDRLVGWKYARANKENYKYFEHKDKVNEHMDQRY